MCLVKFFAKKAKLYTYRFRPILKILCLRVCSFRILHLGHHSGLGRLGPRLLFLFNLCIDFAHQIVHIGRVLLFEVDQVRLGQLDSG